MTRVFARAELSSGKKLNFSFTLEGEQETPEELVTSVFEPFILEQISNGDAVFRMFVDETDNTTTVLNLTQVLGISFEEIDEDD